MKPYFEDDCCQIYHGDCREIFGHNICADVMITDPPYGIEYESNWEGVLPRKIIGDEDWELRDEILAIWCPKPALVFGTWKVPTPKDTRQILIWDSQGALGMGALDLPWKPSHHQIYVLGKGFKGYRSNDVLSFHPAQSTALRGRYHPHEKPVKLLQELISKCPEGIIIDPCMGSGSTLVAAKNMGRQAIGIDIERWCCEIAVKRLSQEVLPLRT